MRLIDADEFENDIRKVLRNRHRERTTLALYMMLHIIRDRDTIKVVSPVIHSKWCETHNIFYPLYCDACRRCAIDITPYCPHCGAKMDGGNEND